MLCLSFFVLIPLLAQLVSVTTGQLLTAEYLDNKLPHRNYCPKPYYDGDDSIFLYGGCSSTGESYPDIWKFSILSGTLQKVGSLPGEAVLGSIQPDNFGNHFYFGGGESRRDVYKFDSVTNRTTIVARFPYSIQDNISVKYNDSSNTVFILGGSIQGRALWSFDMETLTISLILTNLTFSVMGGTTVRVGSKAYVFDSASPNDNRMSLELDLDTFNMRSVGPPTLPIFSSYPSSVWDGTYAYLVGGYLPDTESLTDRLIQFDPRTLENNFIFVRNFPVRGLSFFAVAPASVFVPNSNRIYFFGGLSGTGNSYIIHDEIFYIDLTPLPTTPTTIMTTSSTTLTPSTTLIPSTSRATTMSSTTLNPDFFTCKNRPNGLYPHPTDCSLFIGCQDEEMTVFSCSSPLLFDSVTKSCNYPEEVECGISCIDRPDGPYPHPHDCSLYINCLSGSANIQKCPPPLLFHPGKLSCEFPEGVNCSTT